MPSFHKPAIRSGRVPFLLAGIVAVALSGCGLTTAGTPAGYADGSKQVTTPNLIFSGSSKGIEYDSIGVVTGLADVPVTYQTINDPNVIIATVEGQNITLNWNALSGSFVDANGTIELLPVTSGAAADGQVTLRRVVVVSPSSGNIGAGYFTTGLVTDPAQIAIRSGTANYVGIGNITVFHGVDLATSNSSFGSGTAVLNADFLAGTINGTLSVTDTGASSPGFAIAPTTVILNPATIAGNGFNGTWSATSADLNLSAINSTAVSGKFYGLFGADVGGSLNGTGVSANGTTPAYVIGGFMGQ